MIEKLSAPFQVLLLFDSSLFVIDLFSIFYATSLPFYSLLCIMLDPCSHWDGMELISFSFCFFPTWFFYYCGLDSDLHLVFFFVSYFSFFLSPFD